MQGLHWAGAPSCAECDGSGTRSVCVCQGTVSLATSGCRLRYSSAKVLAVGSSFWSANIAASWEALSAHAQPAVDDGENVVRGEIVGVDALESFVLDASLVIFVLLVEGEAKLAMSIARTRNLVITS